MTTHILKTWPVYFDAVQAGLKTFEIRRDDRAFQKGDIVELQRTLPDSLHSVERDFHGEPKHKLRFRIGWVLTGGQFGIEPGFVVFSLLPE
jgi:hypothetical protein